MSETASFGQWLKQHRKALDLTQEGLAERIGCSYIAIHKIEAGERRPSRQIAELLADLFKVPTDELQDFISFSRGLADRAKPAEEAASEGLLLTAPAQDAPGLRPGKLPARLTRLIGRDDVVAVLRDLLSQERVRLLTLTGPPGIGKTRLALEVAHVLRDHFKDGVFFVNLAPVNDADLVTQAIIESLGLAVGGTGSLPGNLQRSLSDRELLLLLDNFEQVIKAAPAITSLMEGCPRVKVMATSRESLHVPGEQ